MNSFGNFTWFFDTDPSCHVKLDNQQTNKRESKDEQEIFRDKYKKSKPDNGNKTNDRTYKPLNLHRNRMRLSGLKSLVKVSNNIEGNAKPELLEEISYYFKTDTINLILSDIP